MDKIDGKKRTFNACRCKHDAAGAMANKKKSKTPSKRCKVVTKIADKKGINQLKYNDNNNRYCGPARPAALPDGRSKVAPPSSSESLVYLGTFDGNSICCSIYDLTCSPACLVVKQDDNFNSRRLPIGGNSINKFHQFHPPPPPLLVHQSGDYHQGFRLLKPKSFASSEPRKSNGLNCKPPPKKKDRCKLEPGCFCTGLNKMPLDLSTSISEDTVLEQVLDTEQDLVPFLEDMKVTELARSLAMPFSIDTLLEMYRVNFTDTFGY